MLFHYIDLYVTNGIALIIEKLPGHRYKKNKKVNNFELKKLIDWLLIIAIL